MDKRYCIPYILESERTPLVEQLLDIIEQLKQDNELLRDEIRRLKKLSKKPAIKPSSDKTNENKDEKPARTGKAQKTKALAIHTVEVLKVTDVPPGAIFKGYRAFTVQDLIIQVNTICFKRERWQWPDGRYVVAELPIAYRGQHFGPQLRAYVLHQYHHQQVTQPLLLKQLRDWGLSISAGQLNDLLIKQKASYHQEKDQLFKAAMAVSPYVQTDDTGARHQGRNGFCNVLGNAYFAYFSSTESKSRRNFLQCLQGPDRGYYLDAVALQYLMQQQLPYKERAKVKATIACFNYRYLCYQESSFDQALAIMGITRLKSIALCKEAALFSYWKQFLVPPQFKLLSDEAGQFRLSTIKQGLCWLHAQRKLEQLIPYTDYQMHWLTIKRATFWALYRALQAYKEQPCPECKRLLQEQFDQLCAPVDDYLLLSDALQRIHGWRDKLLLVLDHPELPLHNNTSEQDLRDYVMRRNRSGSTRSTEGRQCRDTFASLKKTCYKLNVSFWDYVKSRNFHTDDILPLTHYLYQKVAANKPPLLTSTY